MVKRATPRKSTPARFTPSSPGAVIALFVGYVETLAVLCIGRVSEPYVPYVLTYVMGLPLLVLVLYAVALAVKPEILTGIADWGSSQEYFEAVTWRRRLQLRNASHDFDALTTRVHAALPLVDELLIADEFDAAKRVARTYLKAGAYRESLAIATRILESLSPEQPEYYVILGNSAYALIGIGDYNKAIDALLRINTTEHFQPWHAAALAYAFFRKGDHVHSERWLEETARDPHFAARRDRYATYYRDFEPRLLGVAIPVTSQAAIDTSS